MKKTRVPMFIKGGSFYFKYIPEVRPYWKGLPGNLYLMPDIFGKIILKRAFEELYGEEEGRKKYGHFWGVNDWIIENGVFKENTGVLKLIIKTPITYAIEVFKFGYNQKEKFFYFMGDKGNIIRFGGKPNFIIEAYSQLFDKDEYIDFIKALWKTTEITDKDPDFGIFKMVYDFDSIRKLLNGKYKKGKSTTNSQTKG